MVTEPVRLALVGLGGQGQEHLVGAQACEHACFVAAVDESPEQRQATKACYPQLPLYGNLNQLLEDSTRLGLEGLVFCLPHHCYGPLWQMVAASGLPVLKEKPLGRTLEEARSLHQQIEGKLKTAVQRRHHASYQRLHEMLLESEESVVEISAWLHLGRQQDAVKSWRNCRHQSGGGILLDAGYHIVDLSLHFAGPYDLVSCSLWSGDRRARPEDIEDEARLLGRNQATWIMLDARLGGDCDANGTPQKQEGIAINTKDHQYQADRTRITKNGETIWQSEKAWEKAMASQLAEFAEDIRLKHWHTNAYWDQLPAMYLMDEAYQIANRF